MLLVLVLEGRPPPGVVAHIVNGWFACGSIGSASHGDGYSEGKCSSTEITQHVCVWEEGWEVAVKRKPERQLVWS